MCTNLLCPVCCILNPPSRTSHLARATIALSSSARIAPLPDVPTGLIRYTASNSLAEGDGT
jgi:hypothetical protein